MFNSRMLKIMALVLLVIMAVTVVGCGKKEEPKAPAAPATNELSGTIQIAGSTSVQPLSEELAKAFMSKNPKVRINVAGGGSGAGIKAAQGNTADIGASSRDLKPEEKTVKELIVALDGIAVVVHKDNKVADINKEDLKKIFLGQITDWSQVGGDKGAIRVYTREEGSGTRGAFEEIVTADKIFEKANVQNSTGAVRTAVAGDKNGIGYVSLASVNADVKAVKVDGIEATEENIKAKSYKVARPFVYMTKADPAGIVKAYLDFVMGDEGQAIVKKSYISVK